MRKDFGRRSGIEPVIWHLKNDFRLARNYLKGTSDDAINVLVAATAFNQGSGQSLFFALVVLRGFIHRDDDHMLSTA